MSENQENVEPSGMPADVAGAKALATAAHLGQVDKAGRPYIEHPAAVAASLIGYGPEAVMAGWLHDVVEDTSITLPWLRDLGFPKVVVDAVDAVTRREGEKYMDLIRRAAAHPLGRIVKLADNRHNSSPERLAALDDDTAAGLAKRYRKAREVLLNGVLRDPHEPGDGTIVYGRERNHAMAGRFWYRCDPEGHSDPEWGPKRWWSADEQRWVGWWEIEQKVLDENLVLTQLSRESEIEIERGEG